MRKSIFESTQQRVPEANTVNEAGGVAYSMTAKHELAQYATTGTFGDTFYVSGDDQLKRMKELVPQVETEYLAKLAIYARQEGYMKAMPAYLAAVLTTRGEEGIRLLKQIFPDVINNGRMLRNFVQTIRSGVLGRKSLGTAPRNLVRQWLQSRSPYQLFRDSVGNDPSIADVIKMVHPTPRNEEEEAFYGYLIGKEYKFANLPSIVQEYETFKNGTNKNIPNVEFRLLTGLELSDSVWKEIARNAKWMMTRMNINTFTRHNVFDTPEMIEMIANRLKDPEEIAKSMSFPFELLTSYKATTNGNQQIPRAIINALQDAMDISCNNAPEFVGKNIVVCVDTSGSMRSPVLGRGDGQRRYPMFYSPDPARPMCVEVAGIVASAILRKNQDACVIPFDTAVRQVVLNPRDTVTTNIDKLAQLGGGGTNCSAPLTKLNSEKAKGIDLVVYVSDYESWIDSRGNSYRSTTTMIEWKEFKKRNPKAKMVCIDCAPNGTVQAPDRNEIINIGGFSDVVFKLMEKFVNGDMMTDRWVDTIESITLG